MNMTMQLFEVETTEQKLARKCQDLPDHFNRKWRQVCQVTHVVPLRVDWMIRRHYLQVWPGVRVCVLGLECLGIWAGVVVFALPPAETFKRYGGLTWELARLWISDVLPRNAETWLIGRCIRHVTECHQDVQVLVSYADPAAGHTGTMYRAANWTSDGMTDEERITPRADYRWHGKLYSRRAHVPKWATGVERVPRMSKFRFVYKLKRAKALVLTTAQPKQMELDYATQD